VIADAAALATQRMGWASVRRTQEDLIGTLAFTWASAGGGMGSAVFDACHDLTLVFAYFFGSSGHPRATRVRGPLQE
jgi:hypothetical protein